jgi:hypothetical protein
MMTTLERTVIATMLLLSALTLLVVATSFITPLFGRSAPAAVTPIPLTVPAPASGPACPYVREA